MDRHIYLYGEIGWEINANSVQEQMNADGEFDDLVVHISSPGGGVFEGWTIGNIIKNSGKNTVAKIEGLCASIATYVALSCQTVEMADTGRFMIHNPSLFVEGEEDDMEAAAEQLAAIKADLLKTYKDKTGLSEDELSVMMDEQTWLTPEEAKEAKFIDTIIEPVKAVARYDFKKNKTMKQAAKLDLTLLDKILDKAKGIAQIFNLDSNGEPVKNVTVELADGGSLFIESEDGELEGKKVFTIDEEGNPTETEAADGTFKLTDGRSITIESGVVESVQEEDESEEDKLKAAIEDQKTELAEQKATNDNLTKAVEKGQAEIAAIMDQVMELKKKTAGATGPAAVAHIAPIKKVETIGHQGKAHSLNGFAQHLKEVQQEK